MKGKIIKTSLLLFLPLFTFAQEIAIETWRSHLNYSSTRLVARYQNKIYASSEFGFFYFDLEDNSLNPLTKNDGFSEVGITALRTIPDSGGLIIGYQSGVIEILQGNTLTTIDDIKRSAIHNTKTINDIVFHNNLAYMATDFGLIALDYVQKEIKESYSHIGEAGTTLAVNAAAVYHDSIFLATPEGIIATSLHPSNNLLDFNNWRRFSLEEGITSGAALVVATFNDTLYAGVAEEGLHRYNGFQWEKATFPSVDSLVRMRATDSFLYIITSGQVYQLNAAGELKTIAQNKLKLPSDIVQSENGDFWIADLSLGLVSDFDGDFSGYSPDGPFSDHISKLTYFDNKIAGIERGISSKLVPSNNPAVFAVFEDGKWKNYTARDIPVLSGVRDFTDIAYNSFSETLYFSSFGAGTIGWKVPENTFFSANVDNPQNPFTTGEITAIAADISGINWFSEHSNPDLLHAYEEHSDQWYTFSLGTARYALEVLPLPYGDVWLRLAEGLLVVNVENGASKLLSRNNNSLIADQITDFDLDKDGLLWYGTSNGVSYILNPGDALDGTLNTAIPNYENEPLFKNEFIYALEVDGANRKWIGTKDGLWLFGPDGDELVYHFTEANSPLLSNIITDIEINNVTGEVFIATTKGLVSFRSNATEGGETHQQVKIFPNPVKQGYNGQIGITGLANNAIVKITDLSGNLVREINAGGGTATWDGNSLSGRSVNTGVYLVFSSSEDGKETFVGKIAVIR